jgi:hypothetical protein
MASVWAGPSDKVLITGEPLPSSRTVVKEVSSWFTTMAIGVANGEFGAGPSPPLLHAVTIRTAGSAA